MNVDDYVDVLIEDCIMLVNFDLVNLVVLIVLNRHEMNSLAVVIVIDSKTKEKNVNKHSRKKIHKNNKQTCAKCPSICATPTGDIEY